MWTSYKQKSPSSAGPPELKSGTDVPAHSLVKTLGENTMHDSISTCSLCEDVSGESLALAGGEDWSSLLLEAPCPFTLGQSVLTASRSISMDYIGGVICGLRESPCKVLQLPDEAHPGQVRVQLEDRSPRNSWRYKGWVTFSDLQDPPA